MRAPRSYAEGVAMEPSRRQRLADMRSEIDKLKQDEVSFEEELKKMGKERQERRDRQNALNWLRTLLFPFIEEKASAYNTTIRQATEKIVTDKTRIDLVLRENWDNSEIRQLLDSGPARMVMSGSANLLNETDEKTAEGARWLLHKVLPEDVEGLDIQEAFLKDEGLWVQTIIGLKKLFASRIGRPSTRSPRTF